MTEGKEGIRLRLRMENTLWVQIQQREIFLKTGNSDRWSWVSVEISFGPLRFRLDVNLLRYYSIQSNVTCFYHFFKYFSSKSVLPLNKKHKWENCSEVTSNIWSKYSSKQTDRLYIMAWKEGFHSFFQQCRKRICSCASLH